MTSPSNIVSLISFGSVIFYKLKKMVSVLKDKNNKMKYFLGGENYEVEETCEENKNKNSSGKKKNPFQNIQQKLLSNDLVSDNKQEGDSQIVSSSMVGDGSRDEVISVFVSTSKKLQDMVRGYEAKVNQTTSHVTCLQHHVYNLHEQLASKNKVIARVCDRYMTLCKEKKASEEHLQKKIDELNSVVEACMKNDTSQLQRLLIQQIGKNRSLEHQNEILSQRVAELCRQKTLVELR